MRSSRFKISILLTGFLLAICLSTRAEVKLPAIFSDGMVMQQKTNANLWGTATPNKNVTITTSWDGKAICSNSRQERSMEAGSPHSRGRGPLYCNL